EQLQSSRSAEGARARRIAERVGHALRQPGTHERLTHRSLLAAAVAVPREHDGRAADRGRDPMVAPDADDFFDQIVLDGEITPEARDRDVQLGGARAHAEAETREDPARLGG